MKFINNSMDSELQKLRERVKQADPSISVDSIKVEGNVTGNIVVGNRNVIGDHNVVYEIHTLFGTFIQQHNTAQPSISKRARNEPPHAPYTFLGRQRELSALEDYIRARAPVLLYGQSGLGKTSLLQKVANTEAAQSMPDGVVYLERLFDGGAVSLQDVLQRLFDRLFESNPRIKLADPFRKTDPVPAPNILARLFPKFFAAKPSTSLDDPSLIETSLASSRTLLLLDELGIDQGALNRMSRLLSSGAVVATSQQPPSDDTFEYIQIPALTREEAIQLFARKSNLTIDSETYPLMGQICEILKDVPLAITILANAIRQNLPLLMTADPPDKKLKMMVGRLGESSPLSQDVIQAAIERSFRVIYNDGYLENAWDAIKAICSLQLRLLVHASAAPGKSLNREWLEAEEGKDDGYQKTIDGVFVTGNREGEAPKYQLGHAAEYQINALIDLELLTVNSPLRLPDAIRSILQLNTKYLEAINLQKESERARAGLLDRLLNEPREHYLDSEFVNSELGNILGSLQWAFQKENWQAVIELGQAIDPYLTLNGLWDVWGTVLKQVQIAARNIGDLKARSWALHQLGARAIGTANREQAEAFLKHALEIRIANHDVAGAAYTLHNIRVLWLLAPPIIHPPQPDPHDLIHKIIETLRKSWQKLWSFSVPAKLGVLAAALLGVAAVTGVLAQPFWSLKVQAKPTQFSYSGQVIEYSYIIHNRGLAPVSGPISVSDDKVNVRCPDVRNIGNRNDSLDWNETIPCTGFYTVTDDDIRNGALPDKKNVIAIAGDNQSRIEASAPFPTISFNKDYLTLDLQAQPEAYANAGQIITIAYIVKNQGATNLSGPLKVIADGELSINCPNQPDNSGAILKAGESVTCIAQYMLTNADVENGSVKTTASASVGTVNSESKSITIYGIVPPVTPITPTVSGTPGTPETPLTPSITSTLTTPGVSDTPSSSDTTVTPGIVTAPATTGTPGNPQPLGVTSPTNTPHTPSAPGPTDTSSPSILPAKTDQPSSITLFQSTDRKSYETAGQPITYTYVILNQNDAPISGTVTVKDNLSTVKCPDAKMLDPGKSITCTATYRTTDSDVKNGSITDTAVAYIGRITSEPQSETIYANVEPSNLTLSTFAQPKTYQKAGQTIQYKYFITNDGKYPLSGPLIVKDNKTKVNCPALQTIGNGDDVLDPGERLACDAAGLITDVDIQSGSVTNAARATIDGVDSNPASSTIDEQTVNLAASANPEMYQAAGDIITYTYAITGKSRKPLAGAAAFSDSTVKPQCQDVQEVGNKDSFLDWNETITCTSQYSAMQSDIDTTSSGGDHGAVTSTVSATVDGIQSNQVTVAVVGPAQQKAISIAVAASPQKFDTVDEKITYTYTITNEGNVTLFAPLQVSDDHVNNGKPFNCGASRQLSPKGSATCTGSYTIVQSDFEQKSVINLVTASSADGQDTITAMTKNTISCQYAEGWVSYPVDPDESLDHIATWFLNVTQADLQKANCMGSATSISKGQILYVPSKPPTATISGFFEDASGQRLSGVPVTLINTADGSSITKPTNAFGEYRFAELAPGTYKIFQIIISVRRGDSKTQNFTITPGT